MINDDIQEITLEFNTDILYGNASLFDESGKEMHFSSSQVDGQTIVVRTDGSLETGNYTVKWRIVGDDGQITEGEYTFIVQNDSVSNEEFKTADKRIDEKNQNAEKGAAKEAHLSPPSKDNEEEIESEPQIVIPLLTGFMLFIALQIAKWLIRREK